MNEKPEALRLAEYLVNQWYGLTASNSGMPMVSPVAVAALRVKAAAELRRLHEENERLREALESIAANACCDRCQEAALVAKAALRREEV